MKPLLLTLALSLAALTARADGEQAGDFDYYVLALSWTPSWCALEGDARGSGQCDAGTGYGFTLHGLWPQYEDGWPAYCRTTARDPSRSQTGAMADIMGSGGLAWHQWKKHGRCSGLSAVDYFTASREAYEAVTRPEVLRKIPRALDVDPKVIEAAFLEVNPGLEADGLTITCRSGHVQEARICLSSEFEPRVCGRDVVQDCTSGTVQVLPIR